MDATTAGTARRRRRSVAAALLVVAAVVAAWFASVPDEVRTTDDPARRGAQPVAKTPPATESVPPRRADRARAANAPDDPSNDGSAADDGPDGEAEATRPIRCVAVSAADGAPIEGVEMLFVRVNVVLEGRRLPPGGTLDLGDLAFTEGLPFQTLLRDEDGKALANAEVWATDPWFDRLIACDREGRIRAERLPDRPFHAVVAPTATTATWRLAIDPRSQPAVIVVGRGIEVRGRVVDAAAAPAGKGVRVRFVPADRERGVSDRATEALCASDGTFVARLQPGRWRAAATLARRYERPKGEAFEVTATGAPSLTIRLSDQDR